MLISDVNVMLRSNSFEGIMPLVSPLVTIVWNVRGVTAAARTSPHPSGGHPAPGTGEKMGWPVAILSKRGITPSNIFALIKQKAKRRKNKNHEKSESHVRISFEKQFYKL